MTRCARPNRVITVDRVPPVLTYHPFTTKIKRFLLQNFRILSMDEQTWCVFPQPPFVVYKRDVRLRYMSVHSTDHTSIELPGSRACQRSRCNTCCHVSSVAVIRGPKLCLYHLWPFHLSVRESFLLYILPPIPTSLHWWDRKKPQELFQRTSAKYTQQHSQVSCGSASQLHWPQYFWCPGALCSVLQW